MRPILESLGLVTVGAEPAWAVTSADDGYRYVLGRTWHPGKPLWLWMMLNPSSARVKDDPTIRKVRGFTLGHGGGGFLVVNAMAYSHPSPRMLEQAHAAGVDVVGAHNRDVLRWAVAQMPVGYVAVAAWGRVPERLDAPSAAGRRLFADLVKPYCLGRNLDGSPRHPARLGYATRFEPLTDAAPFVH